MNSLNLLEAIVFQPDNSIQIKQIDRPQMEDMLIHEFIFEISKKMSGQDLVHNSHLFTVLFILLNPDDKFEEIKSKIDLLVNEYRDPKAEFLSE